ncbi:MAG: ATP-dependent helicase [Lachnospiraceae bacterium]|nr:ATP-dependent helicase [Lachnospiraceae bacterium]
MQLFEHQKQVLDQTKGLNRVAYYLDMGLGKTFVGSEKMMSIGNRINLIICQKSKIDDWCNHFLTNYQNIRVYDLTHKKSLEEFMSDADIKVGLINYELAWRRKQLLQLENFTLMLDESSLIQNQKAKQSKFILRLAESNVILLSGTPTSGKYENLWTQIHLLGWTISEAVYNKQYVNWISKDFGGFIHKIVDKNNPYKNVDRLKQKLREHGAVFMKTEDCFDLPDQNIIKQYVPTTKEYRKFMKDSIITVDDTELVGDTTLTKRLYARQLCGQYNSYKLEAFKELVESTQDRLIVFYNFNAELDALKNICGTLERPVSEVNGHCKNLIAYEQESNSVTLIQYQAGAMGLNLQKANKIIYFTLTDKSELFEQSKKRIHRIGQEKPCFYYVMMCKGSVEEEILNTLEMQKDYTDELFNEYERTETNGN